jgi:photosystem II stability/assembly factor-like uncharacterized protein
MRFPSILLLFVLAPGLSLSTEAQNTSTRVPRTPDWTPPPGVANRNLPKSVPAAVGVASFKLLGPTTGWASTGKALIWTSDNGAHWKDITPPNPHYNRLDSNSELSDVYFPDEKTGFVLMCYHPASGNGDDWTGDDWAFDLSSTRDAGQTWATVPVKARNLATDRLNTGGAIWFADDLHGWMDLAIQSGSAFHIGALLATSDGGHTWDFVQGDPGVDGSVLVQSNQNGWVTDGEELHATLDRGKSFHQVTLSPPDSIVSALGPVHTLYILYNLPVFEDDLRGYESVLYTDAEGSKSAVVLFSTTDGGATWTADRELIGSGLDSTEIVTSTSIANSIWIVPIASVGVPPILLEIHKGETVTYPTTASDGTRASSFITQSQGWIKLPSGLFSTSDGGHTWYRISPTYAFGGVLGSSYTGIAENFNNPLSTPLRKPWPVPSGRQEK